MDGGKAKLCFLAIMDARTLVRTNTLSLADETLRSIPSVLSTKQFHKLIYQTGVIKDVYLLFHLIQTVYLLVKCTFGIRILTFGLNFSLVKWCEVNIQLKIS